MKEIWKDIKGYEGIYQCSIYGNIRSLDRYVYEHSGKSQFRRGIEKMKTRENPSNGYCQIALNKNGKRKMCYVHILIASTFLENPNEYEYVNHKDGNKLNNNIENLEWCTASDNNIHSYNVLNRQKSRQGCHKKPVCLIDITTCRRVYFESITHTSFVINLSPTQINRYIHNNKKWKGRYIFTTDFVNSSKCVEDTEKVS